MEVLLPRATFLDRLQGQKFFGQLKTSIVHIAGYPPTPPAHPLRQHLKFTPIPQTLWEGTIVIVVIGRVAQMLRIWPKLGSVAFVADAFMSYLGVLKYNIRISACFCLL